MLYSHKGNYPTKLPFRIEIETQLVDGTKVKTKRTDPTTFTEDEILNAGYVKVDPPPEYNHKTHKVIWADSTWKIVELSTEEIDLIISSMWEEVRKSRDERIKNVEWRVSRYNSEIRQGLNPTDDIEQLDKYIQALRDATKQSDPYNITWPTLSFDEGSQH